MDISFAKRIFYLIGNLIYVVLPDELSVSLRGFICRTSSA